MPLSSKSTGHIEPSQTRGGAERRPSPDAAAETLLETRIKAEFHEIPGLSPTLSQAARLFDVPTDECARVLETLEREEFLEHLPDGRYRVIRHR